MKILIVDDNEIVVKMLSTMLSKVDCAFDIALTGTQAIDLALANCYDAIFMDIGLPDISGITASKLIRLYNSFKIYTPIIAITAHCDNKHKEAAFKAGMDEFISKPLDPDGIYDLVNRLKSNSYNKCQVSSI